MDTWSLLFLLFSIVSIDAQRDFHIDYANQQFVKDGKPFRYVSGSIHYFRSQPDQWDNRLKMVRAAGLNAIQTYIPWNFHETYKGQYDFTGQKNITQFFKLAQQNDLLVLLRPGPYICGEWENGGLPYWLLKYPNITLRSSQEDFLRESLAWWDVLLPMIKPYLYNNGGPIIMTQIENEYGSYGCDKTYLKALRDKALSNLGSDAVLYTTDPPEVIECGKIENVFATVDFGERGEVLGDEYFKIQKTINKGGPRVNSEYYPGWYLTWGKKKPFEDFTPNEVLGMTKYLWSRNSSFNYYMFHGGTNFGFWNGAEYAGGLITSYDYWAPMSENGGNTTKYNLIRDFFASQSDWDHKPLPLPTLASTMSTKGIALQKYGNIFDFLPIIMDQNKCQNGAKTFEDIDQASGFLKYSFQLQSGGQKLNGTNIKDFGFTYVNKKFKGRTSAHFKPDPVEEVHLGAQSGDNVDILVENQGRLTWLTAKDNKGLVGPVYVDGNFVSNIQSCPLDIDKIANNPVGQPSIAQTFTPGDVYVGQFTTKVPGDTNIDMSSWGKGIVYVNGYNIGRYWSTQGPQKSLYIPGTLIATVNQIVIVEFEKLSSTCLSSTLFCTFDLLNKPISY